MSKGVKNGIKYKEVGCAVKCALRKSLTDGNIDKERFLENIREKSIGCTKITRLASLLIHFVFYSIIDSNDQNKINQFFNVTDDGRKQNSPTEQVINEYFYAVLTGYTESPEYPMDKHGRVFLRMMQTFAVEPPNNDFMLNIFKHQYQQFHTNFKNNIVVHAKKRIQSFLKQVKYEINPVPGDITPNEKKRHRDGNYKCVHQTTRFLFDGTIEFDNELLEVFENVCQPNEDNLCGLFSELRNDWFKLLPIFVRLQLHIFRRQQSGLKGHNFVVVPQSSFQRRHIHIDTESLYGICAQLKSEIIVKKTKKKSTNHPRNYFTKSPNKLWKEILNVEMKGYDRFDYSVFTDGVAVSLCCKKSIVDKTEEEQFDEYLSQCKENLENGEIEDLYGFDPGKRLAIAGVHRNIATGKERNICVKNGKFYRYTREHRRNQAKERIYTELNTQKSEDAGIYGITPSNMW